MVVAQLDSLRSKILSRTLRIEGLQKIYRDREKRTVALFSFSLALNLALAILFPQALFYGAPLLLGVPHLFSSFIFSKASVSTQLKSLPFQIAGLAVCVSYLLQARGVFEDPYFLTLSLALVASILFIKREMKTRTQSLTLLVFAAASLACFFFYPFQTLIALLFGHNLIAFGFWYQTSKGAKARASVRLTFGILCLALAALALFTFKHPESLQPSMADISRLLLGEESILNSFLVQAFLITQSIHYFIWLKAIPDYRSSAKTPGGFTFTTRNVTQHLGCHALKVGIFLAALMLTWAAFFGLETFRQLYLAVAAYHGLFEIAAFAALLTLNRRQVV